MSFSPPRPLLLKIMHRTPIFLAAATRHLMYSAWLAPVRPGKIITIGEVTEQSFSAQSKATSPPSDRVKISLLDRGTRWITRVDYEEYSSCRQLSRNIWTRWARRVALSLIISRNFLTNLRYSTRGSIRDLKMLAKMVCARDSKHHNVGQNLFCTSGIFASKNERNGPLAQTSKGVWNRKRVITFPINSYMDDTRHEREVYFVWISVICKNTKLRSLKLLNCCH